MIVLLYVHKTMYRRQIPGGRVADDAFSSQLSVTHIA